MLEKSERSVEEVLGYDPGKLAGRTITGVKVEGKYDRVATLRLILDNGEAVEIGYWASHADDASLSIEVVRSAFGVEGK